MKQTIVHTIKNRSPETKKHVEELAVLMDKGYEIECMYKNDGDEDYYLLRFCHYHGEDEEDLAN